MLGYVLDPGWYAHQRYADPTGRVGTPHPAVALGLLMSSAVLVGLVVFIQGI